MDVSLLFHDTATNALSEALRGSIKLTMLSQHPNTRLYTFTQDIDGHQDVHRDQGNQEHIDIPKTKNVALAYMSTDQNQLLAVLLDTASPFYNKDLYKSLDTGFGVWCGTHE